MSTLTIAKLRKFVKVRNKSGYSSNMQFWSDAKHTCGFDPEELGDPIKGKSGHWPAYRWTTPFGNLYEVGGRMFFPETDSDKAAIGFTYDETNLARDEMMPI